MPQYIFHVLFFIMVALYKEKNGKPCHYYHDTKRPWIDYTSVSVLKGFFAEKFDAIGKATSSSKKPSSRWYGLSVDEILKAWDDKRKSGTDWGTFVHSCIEDFLESGYTYRGDTAQSRDIIDIFRPIAQQFDYASFKVSAEKCTWIDVCSSDGQWTRKVIADMCESGMELKVIQAIIETGRLNQKKSAGSLNQLFKLNKQMFIETACNHLLEKGLAGTIDIKLENEQGFYIHDIKTDDSIEESGFMGKKMFGPLSYIDDCSYERYCMQVNYYGLMEQFRTKKRFLGGKIMWIKKTKEFQVIDVKNRQKMAGEAIKEFFIKTEKTAA